VKNFILGLGVAIFLIGLLTGAYYFGKNQNKASIEPTPAPAEYQNQAPTASQEKTSPIPTPRNSKDRVSENIKASINSKNYQALEGYMTDDVVLILYATECCGTVTKTKATAQMSYLEGSKGSWDFSEGSSVRAKLIQNNPQNFSQDMIVGISSDKYVTGFKLNSQNEIERIILVSDYTLISP